MKHLQNIFFLLLTTSALSASEQQNFRKISNPSDRDIDILFIETKQEYGNVPTILIGEKITVKTSTNIQIPPQATSVCIASKPLHQCRSLIFHTHDEYSIDDQSSYSLMGLCNPERIDPSTLLINDESGEAIQTGEQECFKEPIKKLVKESPFKKKSTLLIKDAT